MYMDFNITSSIISDGQPNRCNEDKGNFLNNTAWVLDGAGAIVNKRYFPGPSDPLWLVNQIDKSLQTFVNLNISLDSVFKRSLQQAYKEALTINQAIQFAAKEEQPCSAAAALSIKQEKMDYFVLCDCTIGVKRLDEQTVFIKDIRHNELDEKCLAAVINTRGEQKISHTEAFKLAGIPALQKKRDFMNIPGGYGVLTLDGAGIDYAVQGSIPISTPISILLCTDGFSPIFDLYKICTIDDILYGNISLQESIKLLRETEKKDPECLKYPRYKMSDDATAVLIKVK